ncbi:TPA: hypothetical protein NJT27_003389 [Klebsiella pneumoniae]|uniref:hypothetical protein n=1 Tax=Gammaproteobacteria TaxID=1236 RepID=UPI001CC39986|nr:hypothetical protein [Aeromonas caviae]HCG2921404.1 hypothetical protein [Klebsiella pneumoniae]HDT5889321.1 hypothetical protein [Aeromonas dhakensis]GJA77607.1 hypothetical protein KAM354_28430 [Aeromonas caviae]HCG2948081.1 hypothetical protein [Klebsiella pneumoniae]HEB4980364.1 hypothetical protein [Aeromonas dhakensis]
MTELQGIYPKSRAYAREHGQQCAKEILKWRETGIYRGHLLAELANILKPLDSARSMQMAEDLVIEVALEKLASDSDDTTE